MIRLRIIDKNADEEISFDIEKLPLSIHKIKKIVPINFESSRFNADIGIVLCDSTNNEQIFNLWNDFDISIRFYGYLFLGDNGEVIHAKKLININNKSYDCLF